MISTVLQMRKKPVYGIDDSLRSYLSRYARERPLPVSYRLLMDYREAVPLYDAEGRDTLWETIIYERYTMQELSQALTQVYAILKTEGDARSIDHLYVARIDYCSFGNSYPFRVRIVNSLNDNQDYYYIKRADASRVYGLELEYLLSPNRLLFFTDGDTLVEEHIAGIPGDVFIDRWLSHPNLKPIRLAKELIKFNERCFIRLLGDMRADNFVVELTPDVEDIQVRIRPMDFDQQSYSGRKNFYLPQFFKENHRLVEFCQEHINRKTAYQYQREERSQIYRRIQAESIAARLNTLLNAMVESVIAPRENLIMLRTSLAEHYRCAYFLHGQTMGELVYESLEYLKRSIDNPFH